MSALQALSRRLSRTFQVYDVDPEAEPEAYFASQDADQMVRMFDALKAEVAKDGCFPLLLRRKDDYALYVLQNPPAKPARAWLHVLLLVATFASTALVGALFAYSYDVDLGRAVATGPWTAAYLAAGAVQFALPLVAILAVHEGAHVLAARRHGVPVSLPYFIPLPYPFSIVGTMGAVIDVRGPIPTRRALLDIGASGPLAGFVVAVGVIALGLALSTAVAPGATDDAGATLTLGDPLVVVLLGEVVGTPAGAVPHPVYYAGWVGMFVTAMNLLPAGTLDGGHVARAIAGPQARWVAYVALAGMIVLGFWWTPWWVLAAILVASGVVHPQPLNDVTPLDRTRWVVAVATLAVLVLTFTPVPLSLG